MPPRIDPSVVAYQMNVEPYPRRLRVVLNGRVVAESDRALILYETRLPPVFYFPRSAVRMDLLVPTPHHTHCPFKGNASYWTVVAGERRAENAAWTYEEPLPEAGALKGYVAFYWHQMDAWFEDGRHMTEHAADGHARANPFVDWLLRDAWSAASIGELVARLGRQLLAAGVPVWRLQLLVRTLHPQLFATDYTWWRETDVVEADRLAHDLLTSAELRRSPYAPILDGAGGVRRRLRGPAAALDFPILRELHAAGATDYVAMPLPFSGGQVNILSLVTDHPDGLGLEHLGLVHEVMPVLSRLVEVHALQANARGLLGTYLGARTGERVLAGLVRRGDGEQVHAVIWLADLRGSTALTEALPRARYLEVLNQFFDCTAGAVLEEDGEVLKLIGDAVLAIFPIAPDDPQGHRAGAHAIAAARAARRRMAEVNARRTAAGEAALAFGIALHAGDLTYGNVGTPGRLDFTVIGAAANQTARIQDLCKTTERWILLSEAVTAGCPEEVVSVGRHTLRGVPGTHALFTLREA